MRLVWIGNGRVFELTYTEHFLGKRYIICIHSGASRWSDTPFNGSPHTHPRKPNITTEDWDWACKKIGREKWDAFCRLCESKRRYSHHLTDCKAEHIDGGKVKEIMDLGIQEASEHNAKKGEPTPDFETIMARRKSDETVATESMADSLSDTQRDESSSSSGLIDAEKLELVDGDGADEEEGDDMEFHQPKMVRFEPNQYAVDLDDFDRVNEDDFEPFSDIEDIEDEQEDEN